MSDAADLAEEAYHLTKNSFVRYVVENSEPDVRDDFDRRAFSLFEDWSREARYSQMALGDLLGDLDRVPTSSSFPIEFAQFNYLNPTYLLHAVVERCAEELEELSRIAADIKDAPRARDLLDAVIVRQRYYLDRARKLAAEQKSEPPKPPRIKGTSASRW